MFGDMQSDLHFSDDMTEQYKENLNMIVKSQLLKKIVARATDEEYMVCMNILGALRYVLKMGFTVGICVLLEEMNSSILCAG